MGLYGVETCRGRYRYQTPRNLLMYKGPFGNYERGTESKEAKRDRGPAPARAPVNGNEKKPLPVTKTERGFFILRPRIYFPPRNRFSRLTESAC